MRLIFLASQHQANTMLDPTIVANILQRLRPTATRQVAIAGDLSGDFDGWFDGGAFRSETGASVYTFADGSRARVGVHPWLAVVITFADGTEVSVLERQPEQSTQTCAGCSKALNPASTHQVINGRAFHIHCAPGALF